MIRSLIDWGFSCPVTPPLVSGEYWGEQTENGSWTGFMGKMARNEVDLGVVDLYMNIARVGILDYSQAYDSEASRTSIRSVHGLVSGRPTSFV